MHRERRPPGHRHPHPPWIAGRGQEIDHDQHHRREQGDQHVQAQAAAQGGASRRRAHSGMFACFFHGFSSFFVRNMARERAIRGRVADGMITSSI